MHVVTITSVRVHSTITLQLILNSYVDPIVPYKYYKCLTIKCVLYDVEFNVS